ncbi:MAG: fatty acid desaturase [Acidobacteria bacterium]|nr:fatty acid desaturase [Acidobacteriota bacterium]
MLYNPSSVWLTVGLGLLVAAVVTQLANLATTVYLHRALSHRALNVSRPLELLFRTVLWLTTGIRPRQWAAVHRKHHACTDTDEDPHSPARLGWVRVQLTNVSLYRKVASDPTQVSKYARDLPATRLDVVLYDHALLGLSLGTLLLIIVFGWQVALIASLVHFIGYIELSAAVNAIAHTFGKRPYENSATNVWWLALLTAGEGLHNNHHAAPTSARFSLRPHQWDPAWTFIRMCSLFGLVDVRHDVAVFVSTERH